VQVRLAKRTQKEIIMKRLLTIVTTVMLTSIAMADLVTYENKISSPTDGGGGPALWFKNGSSKSGEHILNSGSSTATNTAYRLGGALYTDLWGNANKAFGSTNATMPAVANSTGLFTTGAVGTVSFLFKTPSANPGTIQTLFSQGVSFTVALHTNGMIRIAHDNSGTKYSNVVSVVTDTWYYFAMKWDTAKTGNDLTWYLGATNSTLNSGKLTITSAGTAASIQLDALKAPMQEVAIWQRELSDASIQSQFSAIPEPATVGLFVVASAVVLFLRNMITR
jgi:hypothetical protein